MTMQEDNHETPELDPTSIDYDEERLKREEIAHELEHEHDMVESAAGQEEIDREALKEEALRRLESAQNAKERVNVIATILDTYGADALIGLFFPEVGDATVSATVLAYLVGESVMASMPATDVAKMAWYQLVDAAIGSLPVIGDVGDFFYKANAKAATLFAENRDRLVAEALEAGVPQEEIEHVLSAHSELEHAAIVATKLSGSVLKAA